jgi:hypothetical protein
VFRVDGRTLTVEEELRFDQVPDAVTFQLAETAGRPLAVRFSTAGSGSTTTVETAGLDGYRSSWAELPRVHQIDLRPAPVVRFEWSVTPPLRVLSSAPDHEYNASLYGPLAGRVVPGLIRKALLRNRADLRRDLADWDQYHLHWPEWLPFDDLSDHAAFIDSLRRAEVRIVWTQHNLVPHTRDPACADRRATRGGRGGGASPAGPI